MRGERTFRKREEGLWYTPTRITTGGVRWHWKGSHLLELRQRNGLTSIHGLGAEGVKTEGESKLEGKGHKRKNCGDEDGGPEENRLL